MHPTTEAELAQIIQDAKAPLQITGGDTHRFGPAHGAALSTGGLDQISIYEPGALTLVAGAGTPLAQIEQMIAAEGQCLAFEPAHWGGILGRSGAPTLGGIIAGNISGPRRVIAGAARDCALGVRFVDGTGRILKNGGRVMKNVTGYDLVKLLAGSRGQLGVITEVALKLLPRPETTASLILRGLDVGQAIAAMSAALGTAFEVSAAAYLPDAGKVALRVEGFEASVVYRAQELRDLLGKTYADIDLIDDTASQDLWRGIRDVRPLMWLDGDLWRISVKPSDGIAVAAALKGAPYLMDWGGGLIWAVLPAGHDLRPALNGIDGHASLLRADDATFNALGALPPQNAVLAELTRGIAQKFDPKGLFQPQKAA